MNFVCGTNVIICGKHLWVKKPSYLGFRKIGVTSRTIQTEKFGSMYEKCDPENHLPLPISSPAFFLAQGKQKVWGSELEQTVVGDGDSSKQQALLLGGQCNEYLPFHGFKSVDGCTC